MIEEKKLRIVHVEDDEGHARLIHAAMEKQSIEHELVWLKDGQEGLDYLLDPANASEIDLILLDINLPKVTGIEILECVKSAPVIKLVPIVMMTTSDAKSDVLRAYEHHVNSYMVKPIRFQDIKALVSQIMGYWGETNTHAGVEG